MNNSSQPPVFKVDVHSSGIAKYEVFVNGNMLLSGFGLFSSSHSVSCSISVPGSSSFNVYFVVKDNYYSAKSNTIKVYS